jgi:Predicted dinucleotide-utilizing enzyme
MKKLVIVGCGHLAMIVVNAVINGTLSDYELVGVYSRTITKAEYVVSIMKKHGRICTVCSSLDELLALKPDYLVETASPAGMKEVALPTLKNGTSIVTLSIGALADTSFYQAVIKVAKENGTRVYIASGATGGFDVLRTTTLMGNASANFFNEKGQRALRRSSVYTPNLETEKRIVFSGTAREAIAVFPTGLNVSVAASLASVGPEKMQVKMQSTPGFVGDTQRVEIKNDQVHAVVDVYSATSEIAGWSIVSTLLNIVSPIVF